MRRLTFTTWFAGLFALLTSSALAGPIWDANADFSTTNGNPNGRWTYGWVDNSFINSFHLDTLANNYGLSGNIPGWCGPIPGAGGSVTFPVIWKNTGPAIDGVQTGQLSLHPGPDGEVSMLEWTAPAGFSGDALIQGQFLPGDIGIMQVGVFENRNWNSCFGPRRIRGLSISPCRSWPEKKSTSVSGANPVATPMATLRWRRRSRASPNPWPSSSSPPAQLDCWHLRGGGGEKYSVADIRPAETCRIAIFISRANRRPPNSSG